MAEAKAKIKRHCSGRGEERKKRIERCFDSHLRNVIQRHVSRLCYCVRKSSGCLLLGGAAASRPPWFAKIWIARCEQRGFPTRYAIEPWNGLAVSDSRKVPCYACLGERSVSDRVHCHSSFKGMNFSSINDWKGWSQFDDPRNFWQFREKSDFRRRNWLKQNANTKERDG